MHSGYLSLLPFYLILFGGGAKVDIHEIEERKNLHINDLMKNHEKAFGQMKAYYNDITNDNLKARRFHYYIKAPTTQKKTKTSGKRQRKMENGKNVRHKQENLTP